MQKIVLSIFAFLLFSSAAIAGCNSFNFGFGSYTWGSYTALVYETYYSESAGTFVTEGYYVDVPCNGGDHWSWMWD